MKHKTRKIAALVLALALVLGLAIGGTWAYFTYSARTTNVITTGTVQLSLTEELKDGKWEPITQGEGPDQTVVGHLFTGNIMPGETVTKKPVIQNVGPAPFYTRAKITVTVTPAKGSNVTKLSNDVVQISVLSSDWLKGDDGWYYYTKAVNPATGDQAGEQAVLFETIKFAESMGNDYQGCTVSIGIQAQAVQTANNDIPTGGDVTDVLGWPAEPEQ